MFFHIENKGRYPMKRIIAVLMAVTICFITSSVHAQEKILMYSDDGHSITIAYNKVDEYKNAGWHTDKSEVTRVMYAADGSEITVYLAEVPDYIADGWFENKTDILKTLYTTDGQSITVFLSEVRNYLDNGWYDSIDYVTRTLYSPDGETVTLFLSQVPEYLDNGWHEDIGEVTTLMYAPDGSERYVFLADTKAYGIMGWSTDIRDVQREMFALDGRKITVFKADVEAYKNVGWYEVQTSEIDPSKPMLALTFDDGPSSVTTPVVLDTLEYYGARATFFVLGSMSKNNTSLLKRMSQLGCTIGNHTYGHPDLKKLSDKNIKSQFTRTDDIIKNAVGFEPTIIRPPYGSYNQRVMQAGEKPFILWSVDTLDWKYRDAEYVKNHVLNNARDGAIILMHDIHASTAEAVKSIVPELLARGYQLVTVDELAMHKGYTLESGKSYASFR